MIRLMSTLMILATIAVSVPVHAEPKVVARYKDWAVFRATENGETVCYVGSTPSTAVGDYTVRGDTYVIVSIRPTDSPNGVLSVEAGYPYKAKSRVTVDIDGKKGFELFTRNRKSDGKGDAWADDDAADEDLINAMKAGREMVVKGRSRKGTLTTDTYSLLGFTRAFQAIDGKCSP